MIFFIVIFAESIKLAILGHQVGSAIEKAESIPTPGTLYAWKIDAKTTETTGGRGRRGAWGAQGKRGPMAHNPATILSGHV